MAKKSQYIMKTQKKPAAKKLTFGQAFKKNRKEGKATFTWNGKRYSTKTKEEVSRKSTRTQARAARKKGRVAAKGVKGIRAKMAERRKGRVAARKIKRSNRALRRKS
tara:strand:+ start:527 stop:847 length:321 start_codon:yes stop_codon:yes gene_type:complete